MIQIIGRAARNAEGRVIMYADRITDSMKTAIDETNRRRQIQKAYNDEHHIIPKTIIKEIRLPIKNEDNTFEDFAKKDKGKRSRKDIEREIKSLEKQMREAAKDFDFERAAQLRDMIFELKADL